MYNRQRKQAIAALAIVLMVAVGVLGACKKQPEYIDAQGVHYGQYSSAYFNGNISVEGTTDLDDLDIDASGEIEIDGGLTDFGGCSAGVADGDNDVCVQGVLEVDTEFELDGTLDADSTSDFAGTATFSKGSGNAIVVSSGGAIDANGAADIADTLTLSKGSGNAVVISSGGGADINGNIDLDGSADEVQIAVTGYTTQTSDIVTIDGGLTDIGGGTYTVANGDNDLGVAGDVEVEGDVVLASANYPLEHGSSGREVYFGLTSAFTGTTTVLSTTTNIETVTVVLCSVDDPDDDAGDAFICIGSASDGDITLTALDTAGDTSTEANTTVYYVVLGN